MTVTWREEMREKEFVRGTGVGLQVSGDWRKRHEERMQTIGVVRGVVIERRESERYETLITLGNEKDKKPTHPSLDKVNSLGDGWEW